MLVHGIYKPRRRKVASAAAAFLIFSAPAGILAGAIADQDDFPTTTPIKHVVVVYQENVSFDHYFGTYPYARPNADGTRFFLGPKDDTPRVNNLQSSGLLKHNPNAANPFRIDRSVPNTCDQNHAYGAEQAAFHSGLMDKFVEQTGCTDPVLGPNSVMGYYDGNTVTALWNYAQQFAMSDNYFGITFGPSTPGALNVVAGTTFAGTVKKGSPAGDIANGATSGAVIGDPDPYGDVCSDPTRTQITMSGKNLGDLLNNSGITWGSFMGGFADCTAKHTGVTGLTSTDYIPHHAWFQYWTSTANPNHVRPSSPLNIGKSDRANHGYDLKDFWTAVQLHRLPSVSFIKARAYQDGHAGYSDPLDEQIFLATLLNALQKTDEWKQTAVLVTYDDSDGWYDHQMGPIVNQSNVAEDALLGPGSCGTPKTPPGADEIQNGRCGFGPRLPLLVISPYARPNYVDHRLTDQSSIMRFIEENWKLGQIGNGSNDTIAGRLGGFFDFDDREHASKLFLDPVTGRVLSGDR